MKSGWTSEIIYLGQYAITQKLRIPVWCADIEQGSAPCGFGNSGKGEMPMTDAAENRELTEQEQQTTVTHINDIMTKLK